MATELLDQPQRYGELDALGMVGHIRGLPQQCQQAWLQAKDFRLPKGFGGIKRVVVVGMGGSAIGGDLVQGLAALEGKTVIVHRDYGPPPFLKKDTLAVFCSYSGTTEETLSAFEGSLDSPAKKLVLTSGGRLGELAGERSLPLFPITYKAPPRAALGYTFIGLLGLLANMGFLQEKEKDFQAMLQTLEGLNSQWGPEVLRDRNPAKALACRLQGLVVVTYGAGFLSGVARRWKTQINENSKSWAFFDLLPELHHNSVVGFKLPETQKPFVLLLASSLLSSPRLQLRYKLTGQLLEQGGIAYQELRGQGEGALSHMMSLVLLGDWVSYYLALLNGVDPSPNPAIDYLKQQLSQSLG